MNKLLIFIVFIALLSCRGVVVKDESSPLYSVTKGSSLRLTRPLTIPPHRATVLLQYGNVVGLHEVNIYYANCAFEIKTLSEKATIIQPDTFLITRVVDEMNSVSTEQKVLASLGAIADDGSSDFNYTTTMYLESARQPDVLRLACMHWENPADNNYLSIEQMRHALGDIFTLILAE